MRRLLCAAATLFLLALPAPVLPQEEEDVLLPQRPGGRSRAERLDRPLEELGPESEEVEEAEEPRVPPPPPGLGRETIPLPDRWRIVEALGVNEHWYDPYHQNTLKADRPIYHEHWFLNVLAVSDSLIETRRLPTPVGGAGTKKAGSLEIFGRDEQFTAVETVLASLSLIKGDTVFLPPELELRITTAIQYNYTRTEVDGLVEISPAAGNTRGDRHIGLQELFFDYHIRNKSDRFDFDSIRVGIQPFISDFRGFIFQDEAAGVRLFGTFSNNRLQYNLAWFRRLEKDTNSGLNRIFDSRRDDVYVANLYFQDFPKLGFIVQATVLYNRNREGKEKPYFNKNGFLERPASVGEERPHNYRATYLGLNGDGHFGRLNLTTSLYHVLGSVDRDSIAQRKLDIRGWFGAAEASIDFDWMRIKTYGLYGSGDDDPFDSKAEGFDAIFENPQFAGGRTSFFQRQSIPFIGGGGVGLSTRDGLLINLRSSKAEGQSNFVNPGVRLVGAGADFDVLPELRILANASWIWFDDTSVLSVLRNQGKVDNFVGTDLSLGLIYRPRFIENIVFQVSGALLIPGDGLDDLFDTSSSASPYYSVLANVILRY